MAESCSKLFGNLACNTCCKPEIAGITGNIWIFEYADIDKEESTEDTENEDLIKSIALLNSDDYGIRIDTKPDGSSGDVGLNDLGNGVNTFTHTVVVSIFCKTEEAKQLINSLLCKDLVIVLENKVRDTTVKFEIYGWEAGVRLTNFSSPTAMDGGIVYQLTFSGNETHYEGTLPKTLNYGSTAATIAGLNSLIEGATPPETP